ncbi:MAG TPA: hypothetical protein VE860_19385 [Chthoniobacterales bacterium]|nr:hypothetical protein [Chthoniobacterales bacterium]
MKEAKSARMTPLAEALHILQDFPAVPTEAWENAIHVDLQGSGSPQVRDRQYVEPI